VRWYWTVYDATTNKRVPFPDLVDQPGILVPGLHIDSPDDSADGETWIPNQQNLGKVRVSIKLVALNSQSGTVVLKDDVSPPFSMSP